jgi:hypothetical protein
MIDHGTPEHERLFAFGVDSTKEFDTLAQGELLADGTVHLTFVQIDKNKDLAE